MQAFLVTDFLQKLADRSAGLGQIAILVAVPFLVFQSFHERLAGSVVLGIRPARHADAELVGRQQLDVVATAILRAAGRNERIRSRQIIDRQSRGLALSLPISIRNA